MKFRQQDIQDEEEGIKRRQEDKMTMTVKVE
jgi:hypothetical protein